MILLGEAAAQTDTAVLEAFVLLGMKNTYHREGAQAALSPPHLLISTGKRGKAKASQTPRPPSAAMPRALPAPRCHHSTAAGPGSGAHTHGQDVLAAPSPSHLLSSSTAPALSGFCHTRDASSLHHLSGPSLDSLQPVHASLALGSPRDLLCYRQQRDTLPTTKLQIP